MGRGHPECPQRLDAISDHLIATGLDHALEMREAPLAALEQIARAHSSGFVNELRVAIEPLRAFRVAAAHEMRTAVGVAVVGEGHEDTRRVTIVGPPQDRDAPLGGRERSELGADIFG